MAYINKQVMFSMALEFHYITLACISILQQFVEDTDSVLR